MPETVEYSEGVCSDGAAILRNGEPIAIPDILSALEDRDRLSARVEELQTAMLIKVRGDNECGVLLGRLPCAGPSWDSNVCGCAIEARSYLTPSKNKE
ncbi:hypothetical protein HYPP_01476 [Hyphomicrobium sp. ghe19]|nr:hypothetical protein HYPP_01476 [Hyphomicrobium sp. ghe19]